VDHKAGTYSLSINGKVMGYLLEVLLPRSSPSSSTIRNMAIQIISEPSKDSVSKNIQETGLMPDLLFGSINKD
jgi:hypothetical protein